MLHRSFRCCFRNLREIVKLLLEAFAVYFTEPDHTFDPGTNDHTATRAMFVFMPFSNEKMPFYVPRTSIFSRDGDFLNPRFFLETIFFFLFTFHRERALTLFDTAHYTVTLLIEETTTSGACC